MLTSTIVLFLSYLFLSCGFDNQLGLNFACPASWLAKSPVPVGSDSQIKSVEPGTYVIYSKLKINKAGTEFKPAEVFSELYSYRVEDGKIENLSSSADIIFYQLYGDKILANNAASSSSFGTMVDLVGDKTSIDRFFLPTISKDDKIKVLVEAKNLDPNDMGCDKDILQIKITKDGEETSVDRVFSWKDYGLNQLCPENYYISNDGKYFYVIGDSIGGGSIDTLMKYSVDEDKMIKADFLPKDSWLGFWKLDADNGWLSGISVGNKPDVAQRVFKINLVSGEMIDLTDPNSRNIYEVFLSSDGKYWSPVFGDVVDGELNCPRVLSIGEKIINDDSQCLMSGKVVDLVGSFLVVNRDGELLIYDLKTEKITSLARNIGDLAIDPDNQTVEYIGSIKID